MPTDSSAQPGATGPGIPGRPDSSLDQSPNNSPNHSPNNSPNHSPPPADGLAALGWDAAWEQALAAALPTALPRGTAPRADRSFAVARVIAEHRGRYVVAGANGARDATPAGRLRHAAAAREALPAVGDWVVLTGVGPGEAPASPGAAVITAVLPRRTAFRRKVAGVASEAQVVAANADVVLVLTALSGDLSPRRLERYLALAWESGAVPVVVLTKADLSPDVAGALAAARLAAPGVDVVALSAATGAGVAALDPHLRPGRTAVFLGSSGVGKSTLVNRLLGEARLRTGDVRDDGKGRHTTTHRELIPLANGALVIDTPGMRELQLWAADAGIDVAFGDVEALAAGCRFGDCEHRTEPGCAVCAAVLAGSLDPARLEHWRELRRELAYLERRLDERATAEQRARTKVLQRALRSHIRRKYGG